MDLWRFVTFDRRLPGWKPDRLLTIAPLSDHLEIAQEIPFWKGARQELIDYHERLRKSAEAAARREERQRHGQQPQAKRPRAAAKPRSAQAAAAKAARARDPEHQALLAVCDVELPSASDFSQGDGDAWGELVAEVAEVSDGSESDELFGKDPALDTPLAALLRTEDADIVAADPGVNSDQTDSLFGPSSEEDVPKPMQTTLKVRAQAGTTPDKGGEDREGSAPVSLLQGESSSQSSSSLAALPSLGAALREAQQTLQGKSTDKQVHAASAVAQQRRLLVVVWHVIIQRMVHHSGLPNSQKESVIGRGGGPGEGHSGRACGRSPKPRRNARSGCRPQWKNK